MAITVKDISEIFSKDVFTDRGYYCGKVSDIEFDLSRYKVRSLVISAAKGTFLGKMVGGKKGIIVPYPMVQAIGDVVLIKHIATPLPEEGEEK
jgi:sporulation protein YlmC with PRC-barrel domain